MRQARTYIPDVPLLEDDMLDQLEFEFSREELLARMKENRDKHALAFKQALVGYYLEVAEQAKDIAAAARKLSKASEEAAKTADKVTSDTRNTWHISASMPEDHTSDYDRVIDMFELAKMEEVTLNEHQFSQYIRDEWEWKARVFATNAFYGGKFGSEIEAVTGSRLIV